jgi:hypothetical protein
MSRVQALECVNIFCFVTDNLHDFSLTVTKKKREGPVIGLALFFFIFLFSLVFLFFFFTPKKIIILI